MAEKTYNITLTANHQSLTAEYLPLAAESVQYLTAKVVCETEDWTGREIKALFGQGCTVYEIPVTGGEITAKQQLNLTAGDWCVWLVGNSARDGEVIPRITTNVAHISVAPTGGTEGNPFPTIPPTVEEQLRADMGNLADLTTEDKSSLVAAINEVRQQPDWNQNDESAQDYIKNRTHWKEEVKPLKIDGIGVKYTDDGWYLGSEFPINQDVFFADCPISICKRKMTTFGGDLVGIFAYANTNKYKQVALLDENGKIIVRFGLVLNMSEVVDGKVYYLQYDAGNMDNIENALKSLGYTLEDVRGLLLLNNIERFEHIKMKTLSSSDGSTICTFNDELYDDMTVSTEYTMLPFILEGGVQDGAIIWLNLSMIMPYKCISIYDSQDNLVFWFNSSKAVIDRTNDCYFDLVDFKYRKDFYYAKDINFDPNAEYTAVCESNLFVHSALSLYEGALVRTYTPKDVIFKEGSNVLIIVDAEAVNIIGDIIPNNGRSALIQYMTQTNSYDSLHLEPMVSLDVGSDSLTAYCGFKVANHQLNSKFTLIIFTSLKAAYEYYKR